MRKEERMTKKGGASVTWGSTSSLDGVMASFSLLIGILVMMIYTFVAILAYNNQLSDGIARLMQTSKQPSATGAPADKIYEVQHSFPIRTSSEDMEEILHPGFIASKGVSMVPNGLGAKLSVPKFFDESSHGAAYGGSIRNYLGNWGERLITPEEAASIGSWDPHDHETIFVSIASYRDPECTPTVQNLFERAKHPERIRVAIIDQRRLPPKGDDSKSSNEEEDPVCGKPLKPCSDYPKQVLCQFLHSVDYYQLDVRLSVGPVFARHLAHRHYRGEYFAMQVDSHVRFVQDWDDLLASEWKRANNEMAVLTTYLSDINGRIDPVTHRATSAQRPIICNSDFDQRLTPGLNHLRLLQQPEARVADVLGQPSLEPYWAGGFSFARGHFVIQVPYDQHLPMVFQGEEISMGLRGFTYGYDYYAPEKGYVYHIYAAKRNKDANKRNNGDWEHRTLLYHGVGERSIKRLNSILGFHRWPLGEWSSPAELEKYGLGKVRTTSKFFATFGIDVKAQTIEHHLCDFVGTPSMMKEFMPALRENRMGLDYNKIFFEFKDPVPKREDYSSWRKRAR